MISEGHKKAPQRFRDAKGSKSRPILGVLASWRLLLIGLPIIIAGCSTRYINEEYGRRGSQGSPSINGTGVLGSMFRSAGHRVRSWRSLSPSLAKADVIVWFVDEFEPPSVDAKVWLEDWLYYNDEAKTLVLVGRDYVAGPTYWKTTLPRAPAPQQPEFRKRLAQSESDFQVSRPAQTTLTAKEWFTLDTSNTLRKVTGLRGTWAEGVNVPKTAIEHRRFLQPVEVADVLLADDLGHPLVSEIVFSPDFANPDDRAFWENGQVADSRLVMIENGSFLLNGALVNHEHRKLAGKLVAHVGKPRLDVVFLESDHDPPIHEKDPSDGPPTGFALFGVWPIGAVLAQFALLGIVFAIGRLPIFGVARRLEEDSLTDFGRHVDALGRLLGASRDRAYALAQLRAYFRSDRE